jgi:hypothetical protein
MPQSTLVCLSQIAREFKPSYKAVPSWPDVRMPNAMDLSLFDKACFMHDGKMHLHAAGARGA